MASKKARVWKAWALVGTGGFVAFDIGTRRLEVYETARFAKRSEPHHDWRVVRVEIREVLPAPVPPRARRGK